MYETSSLLGNILAAISRVGIRIPEPMDPPDLPRRSAELGREIQEFMRQKRKEASEIFEEASEHGKNW